jgi:hypothetical protein
METQDLRKLDVTEKYLRDIKTSAIIPLNGKFLHDEIEKENIELIKKHREDLIRFEILDRSDVVAMLESDPLFEVQTRKVGRPKK